MNQVWRQIRSWLKSAQLVLIRDLDHAYRLVFGLPTLRYSQISPQLYLGGQYTQRGYRILQKRGITGIVNMRTTARAMPDLRGVEMLHLPTKDQHAPSLESLRKGVKFITQQINNNGKVYIHCAYGEGRGPTMMAAYLISTGLTRDDALMQIVKVRGFIRPTDFQLARLKEFENEMHRK